MPNSPTDYPTDSIPDREPTPGAAASTDGGRLFFAATHREAPVPWHAQVPGDAIERMFPAYEGWVRLSRNENTFLNTLLGDALPDQRTSTLSFYAYARPGQAAAVIFDPFLLDPANDYYGQSARLVYWPSLHPDKRRFLLSRTFNAAVVADSPSALLAGVRARITSDPSPHTRAIWRARSTPLLHDLLDASPARVSALSEVLTDVDRSTLSTMAALGAFDLPNA